MTTRHSNGELREIEYEDGRRRLRCRRAARRGAESVMKEGSKKRSRECDAGGQQEEEQRV
eukprot:768749-Hanusia_phi.AAC.13